jgi:acetylornithine deacetylase/succinyl-diaminopimelate desuccinylase-like protein
LTTKLIPLISSLKMQLDFTPMGASFLSFSPYPMRSLFLSVSLLFIACFGFSQTPNPTNSSNYNQEIKKLKDHPALQVAFDEIERLNPQTIEELILLNEIPAPPFGESKRGEKYQELLQAVGGVTVWKDSIGNVLALRKGTEGKRTIALDGHLDTVFPEETDVQVRRRGDTLFAPGIGDNTRGLMVVLTVLRAMEKANIQTKDNILFVATVGEEGNGDLRGVKYLVDRGEVKLDGWISIDVSGVGQIANRGTGSIRYKVTISGPGGHSWGDFGLANPHHALGQMIHTFSLAASQFTATTKPKTTFNVGKIGGGTSVNSIPFESWMEVDMRSEEDMSLQKMDSTFKSSMQQGLNGYNSQREKGPELTLKLEQIGFRPSGMTPQENSLVARSATSLEAFGVTPRLSIMSGNANWLMYRGIPAVTLGWGGKSDKAHSLEEWWMDENGTLAIKLALLTLVAESGQKD